MAINDAILGVVALIHGEVVKNRVSARTQLAEGLPIIEGDRVQLQQVILNLVVNAIEAMSGQNEPPRNLLISTEKNQPDGVLVAVRIRVRASRQRHSSASSIPSTRPRPTEWEWGCRSATRSSRLTADACGRAQTSPAAPSFNSRCPPILSLHSHPASSARRALTAKPEEDSDLRPLAVRGKRTRFQRSARPHNQEEGRRRRDRLRKEGSRGDSCHSMASAKVNSPPFRGSVEFNLRMDLAVLLAVLRRAQNLPACPYSRHAECLFSSRLGQDASDRSDGLTFWFILNRLDGSYRRLICAKRSKFTP